jgi:hypothetical protein
MSERDSLVVALVAEVLGPRGGTREQLPGDRNPVDEYITGVLAPLSNAPVPELDAEVDLAEGDSTDADDEVDDAAVVCVAPREAGVSSPSLDPRVRPSSIGVCIAVTSQGEARLDICCTWSRYTGSTNDGWVREPRGHVWTDVVCADRVEHTPPNDDGVQLVVRSSEKGGTRRISVFLINRTPVTDRPDPADHIFQPQIRLLCGKGTQAVPLDDARLTGDPETDALAFLYRERRSYARGHLCGAVWKEIDPERPFDGPRPDTVPFFWSDGAELFPPDVQRRFSPPDVRTELTPIYPVNAPEMEWGDGRDAAWRAAHPAPELNPEALSECSTPEKIEAALLPLVSGYTAWAKDRVELAKTVSSEYGDTAATLLANIDSVRKRMEAGLELLVADADARLAFCFANRAMALQSRWSRHGSVAPWRPFQLAFQLLNLPAIRHRHHEDREICDLLWFPTGGGKTEAYLGLAAFTMGLRRLLGRKDFSDADRGAGVAVLSRYTLRLLTIQQFRRALTLVTACEALRVVAESGGRRGWRPSAGPTDDALWGHVRFSIGLWVGGAVTPNGLQTIALQPPKLPIYGALDALKGKDAEGEPAQVLRCPACQASLAIPPEGYRDGQIAALHFVLQSADRAAALPDAAAFSRDRFDVQEVSVAWHGTQSCTLSLRFAVRGGAHPDAVDVWFRDHVRALMGVDASLVAVRPSRPGYFLRTVSNRRGRQIEIDFDVFCPDPACPLNNQTAWWEKTPAGAAAVPQVFASAMGSSRCPIPAYTVDDQVFHRCPSMIVATVDKFARLAFEPKAGAIFGNIDRYSPRFGFYRTGAPPCLNLPAAPFVDPPGEVGIDVDRFSPPDLVLQDELHLIEGPLGSMVGLYETVIDQLSTSVSGGAVMRPKYVASTATARSASHQVAALYLRTLTQFPPSGLSIADNFFAVGNEVHPLASDPRGRLYIGLAAPGRGGQTPTVRIWSRLLQHAEDRIRNGSNAAELDRFWTVVGYFNAIRELAAAMSLLRQDIVQRIEDLAPAAPRAIEEPVELSSRANSLELPGLLDRLQDRLGGPRAPVNAVACTSMFGTGVDVDRLGLMVVHGQPKSTSAYIQATGRVGRSAGGVVVAFFRAARPRDLNHYEFFTAYHRSLYRHVEPVTVFPFSPRARDRALGPVMVALLRQANVLVSTTAAPVAPSWRVQQRFQGAGNWHCNASQMTANRNAAEVRQCVRILEARAQMQPAARRPEAGRTATEGDSEIDRWHALAAAVGSNLLYYEPTMLNPPTREVVLGDLAHVAQQIRVAYENAPNSLREVEATTTFRGWR